MTSLRRDLKDCIKNVKKLEDYTERLKNQVIKTLKRVTEEQKQPEQTFEKDQKVFVSSEGKIWLKRYYSKYEDGEHFCFFDGSTSWSNNGTIRWKYVKPYKEDEEKGVIKNEH